MYEKKGLIISFQNKRLKIENNNSLIINKIMLKVNKLWIAEFYEKRPCPSLWVKVVSNSANLLNVNRRIFRWLRNIHGVLQSVLPFFANFQGLKMLQGCVTAD